jgi:hypothetical protein
MFWILAQSGAEYADDFGDYPPPPPSLWESFWALVGAIPFYLYLPFVIWMAIYCARRDSEARMWLWIILLFQPFGALIYFFVRWLPSAQFTLPKFFQKFLRGNDLRRLEIAAAQIGNAHQFVELGDLLRELGKWDQAAEAYRSGLKKDPVSLPALWGAANVDFHQRQFAEAKEKLGKILEKDFTYKFGDVSLLYAKSLHELDDRQSARKHLEEHVRRWRHPEALYLLATILIDSNEADSARGHLQSMIQDIEASPKAIARRFFFWKGRARRLLRKIG